MHKKKLKRIIDFCSHTRDILKTFYFLLVLYFSTTPTKACKLWAVSSKIGIFSTLSPNELNEINAQLTSFFYQSESMMDGWSLLGYGGLDSDSLAFVQRYSTPAKQDSNLYWSAVDTLLGYSGSSIALGHLRMASSGANAIPNPHPWIFYYNEKPFSLIHNGTVNKNILYNLITDYGNDLNWIESYPPQTFGGGIWNEEGWNYVIDSELILLLIMREYYLNENDLISALQTSFSKLINAGISANQLNIVLSDSEGLYAFGGKQGLFFKESIEHFSIMTSPIQQNIDDWSAIDSQELVKFSPVGYERYPNFVVVEHSDDAILYPDFITMDSAYPNPFNGAVSFSLTSSKSGSVLISIFSIQGSLVSQFNSFVQRNSSKTINWMPERNLPTGPYFVLANLGSKTTSQKILFIK